MYLICEPVERRGRCELSGHNRNVRILSTIEMSAFAGRLLELFRHLHSDINRHALHSPDRPDDFSPHPGINRHALHSPDRSDDLSPYPGIDRHALNSHEFPRRLLTTPWHRPPCVKLT